MKIRQSLLVIIILLFGLAASACSLKPESAEKNSFPQAKSEVRVVKDVWGREVAIPAEVKSIICLGSGAPRLAAYLEAADLIIGNEEHDARALTVLRDYNPSSYDRFQNLPLVGAGGGSGNNNGYPEEIIRLQPDVILAGFSPEAADELARQTNIPVVSVRYISNNFIDETFSSALQVFAEVVGAEKRSQEVLSYIEACKKDLQARSAGLADGQKPKAYAGAVTFNGRHGFAGTYANFGPFLAINALNVADEVQVPGYFEADLEKVLVWDPDVIFLDPGNLDLIEDEYATNPAYFNNLRAVQEGAVYTLPAFNNCGTNITYALINAYYAGKVLFPEQFADVEIAQKSTEILTFFLGQDISALMAENGLYYGKIKIGE